jgi:hypothetical protein
MIGLQRAAITGLMAVLVGARAGSVAAACAPVTGTARTATSSATLQRATQALLDALAPGERAVWEHYTDPSLTYVSGYRSRALERRMPVPRPRTGPWRTPHPRARAVSA